jgi:hypothetical protein
MNRARYVAGVRLGWAIVLLCRPRQILTVAQARRERESSTARAVVRILGLRNLVQAMIELVHPSRPVLTVAALVDAVHAVSFLGFAAARPDRRWRRAVILNVLTAALFGLATIATRRADDTTNISTATEGTATEGTAAEGTSASGAAAVRHS